jgi:predicted transcriptional regulator
MLQLGAGNGPYLVFSPDDERTSRTRGSEQNSNSTQDRILEYINSHPGVHLRQMCRELGLAMGDVQYHIRRLELDGRITSARRGLYRFFYPSLLFGQKQKDVLSFLSLETPREILLSIIERPDIGQDELSRAAGISQPSVSWHLKRLIELQIVEKRQSGRVTGYRVVSGGAAEIGRFIRAYHPTVWERWSGRLADIFISYGREEGEEATI